MYETLLLGTYTRKESQGVYSIILDTAEEVLRELTLLTKEISPTYLAKSAAGNYYSVSAEKDQGGIAAYDKDWQLLNRVTEPGAPLCYVAVDENRQLVYGANYHKGELNVYQIKQDGSLILADHVFHHNQLGPHKNQDHSHIHYTDLTPDQRLAVCDLGTDEVVTYDVSPEGKVAEAAIYHAEDGTGPRHLAFHPTLPLAYLLGELDSSVTVLAYNAADGTFLEKQKVSTLPEDYSEFNSGAAIRVTRDGRFLYASNRGHNSIAVFKINTDGLIEKIQTIETAGDFPRDFNFNQTQQYLICANQNSNNLTLYRRDPESGILTIIQKDVYAPEVVCVCLD